MVMFRIEFTPEAIEDMRLFRKTDRKRIIDEIEKQLKHQPMEETRNRKRLRPNELAEWELRIDKFRVFYDIAFASILITFVFVEIVIKYSKIWRNMRMIGVRKVRLKKDHLQTNNYPAKALQWTAKNAAADF